MSSLFRRVTDDKSTTNNRGRHLQAVKDIPAGRLIFAERPLLALQSLENVAVVQVCHACKAFVGSPDTALLHRFQRNNNRECKEESISSEIVADDENCRGGGENENGKEHSDNYYEKKSDYAVVPCRYGCGYVYCSASCEADAWAAHHCWLCTNSPDIISASHPLVKFKQLACQNNEIFLLAAEWWIAQHNLSNKNNTRSHNNDDDDNDNDEINGNNNDYTDWIMKPWWDVLMNEMDDPGGVASAVPLQQSVRDLCDKAAILLNQAISEQRQSRIARKATAGAETGNNENGGNGSNEKNNIAPSSSSLSSSSIIPAVSLTAPPPAVTALDLACRIGACEQNAMGIRQRHPLCRTVLEDVDFRQRRHAEIIQCLEVSGFIGGDDDDDDCDCHSSNGAGTDGDDNSTQGQECVSLKMNIQDNKQDEKNVVHKEGTPQDQVKTGEKEETDTSIGTGTDCDQWDYTCEEVASFLAKLDLDEDGMVRDLATDTADGNQSCDIRAGGGDGDDLDLLFPPLDGTALYATACKMNHSCDPNVALLYRPARAGAGWGAKYPLTAYCIALKDIAAKEELTISYIDAEESYVKRQEALANYGFTCRCRKCEQEKMVVGRGDPILETQHKQEQNDVFNVFGSDSDDDDQQQDDAFGMFGSDSDDDDDDDTAKDTEANMEINDLYSSKGNAETDVARDDSGNDSEEALQDRLNRLDTVSNHRRLGSIPLETLAPLSSFVIETTSAFALDDSSAAAPVMYGLLKNCAEGLRARDYCLSRMVGVELEAALYSMLKTQSAWPNTLYRQVYWCSVLTAAIGHAHEGSFLQALVLLDKGHILGLPRQDLRIQKFFKYTELHAFQMASGPYPPATAICRIPDYRRTELVEILHTRGLAKPLQFPVKEISEPLSPQCFESDHVRTSTPMVVRQFASKWPALTKWRDLQFLSRNHGHRIVPIELGSMMGKGMKEVLSDFRSFTETYLMPSCTQKSTWSFADATDHLALSSCPVAYLAQHPLLDQIPALQADVDMRPVLCGSSGPSHVYLWIGTGGTRTPLHFDSYDNLFVQLVGAKYVRLYSREETSKLYVARSGKSMYGKQGNMSEIDCENENKEKHPLTQAAIYSEVLLLPGDLLFIPARTWHYVRSLTTSMSINYWF